ncbi:uncharacterized protein LOC111331586 [Stylophora pistillata]|uniref:uncharacterized protein LOC111331586 n=1 Tax=Stylophora pistillata TaxID=50429 RepID=UPI000C0567A3|nr:uncharacterized protein LOC111331586 [Stylophora pistillata]
MLGNFSRLRISTKTRRCFRRYPATFILSIALGGLGMVIYFELTDMFMAESSSEQQYVDFKGSQRVKYVKSVGNFSSACRLPSLDPFHPSIMQFVKDLGKLRCQGNTFSTYSNNVLEVEGEDISSVQYRIIERAPGDDFHTVLSEPKHVLNQVKIVNRDPFKPGLFRKLWNWIKGYRAPSPFYGKAVVEAEYLRVDVVKTSGAIESDVHMQIVPKDEVLSRPAKPGGIPLDISMIMFDSTSAANFQRKMPHTLEYLKKHLNSVVLQGETIVGDGTTAQLCAMLTGIAEKEQPEARRSEPNATTVDNWRWIFRDLKQKGYATLFSEDSTVYAAFNYRLHGFKDPPTDHFARPLWMEADNITQRLVHCIGGRAFHNMSLDYLVDFFRAYKQKPKFSFMLHAVISHDDLNKIGYVDDDLKRTLQTLERESFLENTILIIFGDHGIRYTGIRKTLQGKLEERLPFMSMTVPKWFTEKYPDLYANLIHNSKVLTSPFDVYATLRHILSYPKYPSDIITGQSLFTKIDKDKRTCASAGVEEHWCPCLNLEEVSIEEPIIKKSAEFAVTSINDLIFQHSELKTQCHKLVLKEIKSSFRDMPNADIQFFHSSYRNEKCDSCGLNYGKKSINTLARDTMYQLQFVTSPNEGFYEVTVRMKKGVPSLAGDISRLDAYGHQPHCVQDKYPLLRKYCYCLRQRA